MSGSANGNTSEIMRGQEHRNWTGRSPRAAASFNNITGANAGGPRQSPPRTHPTARIAQFRRSPKTLAVLGLQGMVCVMSIAEVKRLPFAEKVQIMEAIWEDLRAQAERVPVPQWHKDLLDERRQAVAEGREELVDWDSIKDSLPSRRKS